MREKRVRVPYEENEMVQKRRIRSSKEEGHCVFAEATFSQTKNFNTERNVTDFR